MEAISGVPPLKMSFHLNTISHLGSQLYNSVPPAIAELLSNSYDADASLVKIIIDRDNKQISVIDNGHGMSYEELNNSYLVVGRNRRQQNRGFSKSGNRKVTGRKGLGKLAIFGIADSIEVITVCNGLKNGFAMDHHEIMNSDDSSDSSQLNTYNPKVTILNQTTEEENGTSIIIKSIRLASITSAKDLAHSLSNRFNFFDDSFSTVIFDSRLDEGSIEVTNELHLDRINRELTLRFPEDFVCETSSTNIDAFRRLSSKGVTGTIITSASPLQKINQGFVIYSRNKLTQERGFFNERSNDHFNNYATGYFHIDYIDDGDADFISTGRTSIFWEQNDDLQLLKSDLNSVVSFAQRKWRETRTNNRLTEIEGNLGQDFWRGVTGFEKNILEKIKKSISRDVVSEQSSAFFTDLMITIKSQLKFEAFRDYISEIDEAELNVEEIQKLSVDWNLIETKELAKIASGRISTINKLKEFVQTDASETKVIQPFFELFPWILDPRMSVFKREVTFKRLLQEKYPNEELEESNKRIDFLCSSANGVVHIIELKRPNVKITTNQLLQAQSYRAFLKKIHPEIQELKTFLISNRIDMDYQAIDMAESFASGPSPVIVKSYNQLIEECQRYHSEFIEVLDKLEDSQQSDSKESED
ncbi:ATP-binding protein [Exiguobacterium sp. s163]|uniref:ATP-binding protein n=1 Tax=Exiguobacterium sp. s163 TaxID=2751287 RepID=UPI001BE5A5CE|nr:ATP-binding protein [Exiguobacterium sp. s163]